MKLLTREEEAAHMRSTYTGGLLGGLAGLGVGFVGVAAASRRYHFVRSLTLPLKAFLVTSAGTFSGIIAADHASRAFESERNPKDVEFRKTQQREYDEAHAGMSFTQRAMEWGKAERYKIVGGSWLASMATAWALVNRNKYLTGPQKLVQARVYAQFLTLGVLIATAAFEISDSKNEEGKMWEKVRYIDPKDPEHKRVIEEERRKQGEAGGTDGDQMWKDMVAAEEERLKERDEREKEMRAKHGKKSGGKNGAEKGKGEKKDEKKEEKSGGGGGDEKSSSKDSKDGKDEKDKKEDKADDKKDKKDDKKDDKKEKSKK